VLGVIGGILTQPVRQPLPGFLFQHGMRMGPPVVPAQLRRHLEDDEAVSPGGEPALAAKTVELPDDREHGVPCGLIGQVLEFGSGEPRCRSLPPPQLAVRDLHQCPVEPRFGLLSFGSRAGQLRDPLGRDRVERRNQLFPRLLRALVDPVFRPCATSQGGHDLVGLVLCDPCPPDGL